MYVIAIPTYERYKSISKRVLKFLLEGQVDKKRVFIFVADASQADLYASHVSPELYGEIVVGIEGIVHQRNFIARYFPVGTHVVSLDDDVTRLHRLVEDRRERVQDVNSFFSHAFTVLEQTGLNIWGIYPTNSIMHMQGSKEEISTSLKFLVGYCFGFISRHEKSLTLHVEGKEDYEQSIRYYELDGGVVRFNNICANDASTPRVGGLGRDRAQMNKEASEYLKSTFPEYVVVWRRPDGSHQVRLRGSQPHCTA